MTVTKRITTTAMLVAISILLVCVGGWIPRGGLAFAVIGAMVGAVVVIECGNLWAVAHYVLVSVGAFLLAPDKLVALWYVVVFGHYPILKGFIERLESPLGRWIVKVIVFCCSTALNYLLANVIFSADMPKMNIIAFVGLWAIAFIAFDMAYSKLIGVYLRKLHPEFFREDSEEEENEFD